MSITSTIKAMRRAGVPDAQIIDTVLAMDEERLAKGRARTAKSRNNNKKRDVTDVTNVTGVTPPPPSPKKEKSPHTPLKEKITLTPSPDIGSNEPLDPPDDGSLPSKNLYTVEFDAFWTSWKGAGGKGAKFAAFTVWKRLQAPEREQASRTAAAYFADWRKQNPDTNPLHGRTYLSQKRWDDFGDVGLNGAQYDNSKFEAEMAEAEKRMWARRSGERTDDGHERVS